MPALKMKIGDPKPWIKIDGNLCENPLWNAETQTFFWVDIPRGHLYRLPWGATEPERIYSGPVVGGFTLQRDHSLLLFREKDIALLPYNGDGTFASEARSLLPFDHPGSTRFNDVIADPEGRVFAGTISREPGTGGLFRIDRDGTISQVAGGTSISNGLGFSPDEKSLYWTCSTRYRIYRFDYDRQTGELRNQALFFQGTEEDGYPDGLTVDSEGNVYSVRWGSKTDRLFVYAPSGEILLRRPLPAYACSSLAFTGPNLDLLALTTAGKPHDPESVSDLFLIDQMPVCGKTEYRSAILL